MKNKRYPALILILLCALALLAVPVSAQTGKLVKKGAYQYYRLADGSYLKNDWQKISGKMCYFDKKGRRLKDCSVKINKKLYCFDKQGFLAPTLRTGKKGTTCVKPNGKFAKKEWVTVGSDRYYFGADKYMVTGKWVDGCYLGKDGRMARSTWIGKKFVGADGNRVTTKSLKLAAPSAILIDAATGKSLYEKKPNVRRQNASTTKILTAVLALERCGMNETVTFSEEAVAVEPVKLYAKAGEKFKLKDLMYAMMLPSYNDVAEAVGEHIAGSRKKFAALMNQKAKEIGCTNTTFVTASGLEPEEDEEKKTGEHATTAADLAKIARYAMQNQQFCKIIATRSYSFKSVSKPKKKYTVTNQNFFLDSMKGAAGVKTGWTTAAGWCLVGAVNYKNRQYISVVLGNQTKADCLADTLRLMEFAKKNYN